MSDVRTLFLGSDGSWLFLAECALRAVLMFVFALALMKYTGKKEVRQFSVLELLVIIGLGSALGDPMIQTDAPLLPSLTAIAVVLSLYWGLNKWTNHAPRVEGFIEGRVQRVLHDGVVDLKALEREGLSVAEFFGDLRVMHIEHLGQVRSAYVEIDGEVSVFFRSDEEVRPGLPLAPEALRNSRAFVRLEDLPVCCVRCGVCQGEEAGARRCPGCGGEQWVGAVSFQRVA